MKYMLKIEMDNAAFEDDRGAELARILRALADSVETYAFDQRAVDFPVMDINGNMCGRHGYKR